MNRKLLVCINICAALPCFERSPKQLTCGEDPHQDRQLVKDQRGGQHEDEHAFVEIKDLALFRYEPIHIRRDVKARSGQGSHLSRSAIFVRYA